MTELTERWSVPELLIDSWGAQFRHRRETAEGFWILCETDFPALLCHCGHYRLHWPVLPAPLTEEVSTDL